MRTLGALLVAVLCTSTACSSDDVESPQARCERVRDHVIGLRMSTAQAVDRDAHVAVMKRAIGERLVTECQSLSEKQQRCMLDAADSDSAAACAR